jgi:4'-phosphopantetheinyl transferase
MLPEEPVTVWDPEPLASAGRADPLGPRDVHLWLLPLDIAPFAFEQVAAVLNREERDRASRFRSNQDRRRFEAGRGLMRHVLGNYLGLPPTAVRFEYGPQGKPSLTGPGGQTRLEFNLSHSAAWALLGVTRGRAIGVDIEAVRRTPDLEDIARRTFAPAELDHVLRQPPGQRTEGFFTCWTRKEAFVKAMGGGLSIGLKRFVVSIDPHVPAEIRSIDGASQAGSGWTLWGFRPLTGYCAAAAVHGRDLALHMKCLT